MHVPIKVKSLIILANGRWDLIRRLKGYTGTVLKVIQYCAVAAVAADICLMLLQRNAAGRSQQFNP